MQCIFKVDPVLEDIFRERKKPKLSSASPPSLVPVLYHIHIREHNRMLSYEITGRAQQLLEMDEEERVQRMWVFGGRDSADGSSDRSGQISDAK